MPKFPRGPSENEQVFDPCADPLYSPGRYPCLSQQYAGQGFSPSVHGIFSDAPPVAVGRCGLVANGAGQFFIDQQAGASSGAVQGTATWPGDQGVGPGGDDYQDVAEQ